MESVWTIVRVAIAAIIIVIVSDLSKRFPRYGALLLSLPLISVLAFLFSWFQHRDLAAISRLSRETLVLVPLGLPFFLPFVFATRLGLTFWSSLGAGIALATLTIGAWLAFAPSS